VDEGHLTEEWKHSESLKAWEPVSLRRSRRYLNTGSPAAMSGGNLSFGRKNIFTLRFVLRQRKIFAPADASIALHNGESIRPQPESFPS